MDPIICNRCGQCCKDCQYLIRSGSKTSCRIYKNRLGTRIKGGKICILRQDLKENFLNCPYNT